MRFLGAIKNCHTIQFYNIFVILSNKVIIPNENCPNYWIITWLSKAQLGSTSELKTNVLLTCNKMKYINSEMADDVRVGLNSPRSFCYFQFLILMVRWLPLNILSLFQDSLALTNFRAGDKVICQGRYVILLWPPIFNSGWFKYLWEIK